MLVVELDDLIAVSAVLTYPWVQLTHVRSMSTLPKS
jgi:hypothetical protein